MESIELRAQRLQEAKESYQNLQFRDEFIFCKILGLYPEIAKELMELFLGVSIKLVIPQKQKQNDIKADGRGIRLEVHLADEKNTIYDIELITTMLSDYPKRTRFYQGMIDLDLLTRGAKFSELKKSGVIFLSLDDPYGKGRHKYTFEKLCVEEPDINLEDDTRMIILNASGTQKDVSDDLLDFFKLYKDGKGETSLSKRIRDEVEKAKQNDEWRMEYMIQFMRDQEMKDLGKEEGKAEGRIEERKDILNKMIARGFSKEDILKLDFTELEYNAAKKDAE